MGWQVNPWESSFDQISFDKNLEELYVECISQRGWRQSKGWQVNEHQSSLVHPIMSVSIYGQAFSRANYLVNMAGQ